MRLRRPPRPLPAAHPNVAFAASPRVYRVRAHMFRIHPRMRAVSIYCTRCQETLPVEYPWADAAALTEECRLHEVAHHATTVTWAQFLGGGRVSFVDPEWLRKRLSGELGPDTDTVEPPVIHRYCAYEWLRDDAAPGGVPQDVVVRDPVALVEWMGPERAAKELAAA